MSNRETTKLTTPNGKAVELKTYITARERNAMRDVFLSNISVDGSTGAPKLGELKGDLLEKAERKAIEMIVTSYDGSAENIVDRILDAKEGPADYDFIVGEANKVANLGPAK